MLSDAVKAESLFESERLYYRIVKAEDAGLVHSMDQDPLVMRYMEQGEPKSEEDIKASILIQIHAQKKYGFSFWVCQRKDNHAPIGWAGLRYIEGTSDVELGYRFLRQSWGKGYGSEAARSILAYAKEVLALKEVFARTHKQNLASIRVLEKAGMHFHSLADYKGVSMLCYKADFIAAKP